jgi:hypothetical protein
MATPTSPIKISAKEIKEFKEFFINGGKLKNERAGYHIFIRKDGERVFDINGKYKFFSDLDAFVRAAIRTMKRGF